MVKFWSSASFSAGFAVDSNLDFRWWNFKLDLSANFPHMFNSFFRSFLVLATNTISSANNSAGITRSASLVLTPSPEALSSAIRSLIKKLKRIGLDSAPCCRPFWVWKVSPIWFLIFIILVHRSDEFNRFVGQICLGFQFFHQYFSPHRVVCFS